VDGGDAWPQPAHEWAAQPVDRPILPSMPRPLRPRDEGLRAELVAMAERPGDPRHADRLWGVLDDYEAWPGLRLVGEDGERAAWLIAQCGDAELQRRALPHVEAAVDQGDAHPSHYACLLDRVRMSEGRPQVYGSQFVVHDDQTLMPWPIDDPAAVDQRRFRVGMAPLAAQARDMEHQYRVRGVLWGQAWIA